MLILKIFFPYPKPNSTLFLFAKPMTSKLRAKVKSCSVSLWHSGHEGRTNPMTTIHHFGGKTALLFLHLWADKGGGNILVSSIAAKTAGIVHYLLGGEPARNTNIVFKVSLKKSWNFSWKQRKFCSNLTWTCTYFRSWLPMRRIETAFRTSHSYASAWPVELKLDFAYIFCNRHSPTALYSYFLIVVPRLQEAFPTETAAFTKWSSTSYTLVVPPVLKQKHNSLAVTSSYHLVSSAHF